MTVGRIGIPVVTLLAATGCEGRLEHPGRLWLLWVLVPLALYLVWAVRRRGVLLRRFADADLLPRLTDAGVSGGAWLRPLLLVLAFGLLLFSLAGPQWGFDWEEVHRRGVDVVIALDTSESMLVRDVGSSGELSRLERAKREISDLLDLMEGDRVGLVAFAGTAFLELPLTLDYGAAQLFLQAMDTDILPVPGTSLAAAIRTAREAFEASPSEGRALILITDGEDHEGEALEAAREARAEGIRIFAIGIGRDEGAPIPRAGGGFRRDERGEIILSRLDEATLQRIALETDGRYVRSVTGDVDLEEIYLSGIRAGLQEQDLASGRRQRWKSRFQWFVGAAAILLLLESMIGRRRSAAATRTTRAMEPT